MGYRYDFSFLGSHMSKTKNFVLAFSIVTVGSHDLPVINVLFLILEASLPYLSGEPQE